MNRRRNGNQVADAVSHNYRLPFWRYSRVPEPGLLEGKSSMCHVRRSRVLAVWEG